MLEIKFVGDISLNKADLKMSPKFATNILKIVADFEVAKITETYFGYFPVAVNQTGLEAKLTNIHYFPKASV